MMTTYCNPVDLTYRFQRDGRKALEPCREGSDPAVVRFHDKYYLCPSKTEGLFVSDDLAHWSFLPGDFTNSEGYGPDLWEHGDRLFLTTGLAGDFVPTPAFVTSDPASGHWVKTGPVWSVGDPKFFPDADGRMYLYHGCSTQGGLTVQEVDPETYTPVGSAVSVARLDLKHCGWHRPGENNSFDPEQTPGLNAVRCACCGDSLPESWQEGAWMTRHHGQYYLQTSQPGTEFNIYSDDIYQGPTPFGPFAPQADNPLSFKPGGFITGAGHSSTFIDRFGNYFHASTMRIAARHIYERRIGIFPAGFLPDGTMYCQQRFGDYPHFVPEKTLQYDDNVFTGWMLLSYHADADASSSQSGHPAALAFDEDIRTSWIASPDDPSPLLSVDLGSECTVMAVQLNFAESGCRRYGMDGDVRVYRWILETRLPDNTWQCVDDASENTEDRTHVYCPLSQPIRSRHWRVRILQAAAGGIPALSGFRIFGNDGSGAPARIDNWSAERDGEDPCIVRLRWQRPSHAYGVNIRWGLRPDRLHHTWQCHAEEERTLHCLDSRQKYYFALESFGRGGVAACSEVRCL